MSDLSKCAKGPSPLRTSSIKTSNLCLLKSLVAVLLLFSLATCSGRPNVFSEPRDERLRRLDEERSRLERTTDPIGRTRLQIRISDLLISFMSDAIGVGDLERMEQRLDEYRVAITDARDTMINSGRDASRQAGGFRDLEIALRQHTRQLDDIGSRLSFDDRQPIERLITEITGIRDEILDALFPTRTA